MPRKNRLERAEYLRNWRENAVKRRVCVRCGTPLIEHEGKCCANCTSRNMRNLIQFARG